MIRFRPAASRDFVADVRYYEKQYPGRGVRFVAAVELTLEQIQLSPDRFPVLYEPDLRSAKVPRFPYRVVYVSLGGDLDVLAVAHAKRRPGYFRPK